MAIFVANDERLVRNLLPAMLLHNGDTVLEAATGDEACSVAKRSPCPFHSVMSFSTSGGGDSIFSRLRPSLRHREAAD
jgi:CheY-like chemotaxis protein